MPAVPLSQYAVHLRPDDNIAVARKPIPADAALTFAGGTVAVPAPIKLGHKFAVTPIKEGDPVRKYGQIIGFAARNIGVGEHVHVHNVTAGKFERDYASSATTPTVPTARPRCRRRPSGARSWATTAAPTARTTSGTAPATTSPSSAR
jgi:altronate hydrolase